MVLLLDDLTLLKIVIMIMMDFDIFLDKNDLCHFGV